MINRIEMLYHDLVRKLRNKFDRYRIYNSGIDYKGFDDILYSYYQAMPCESLDKIFEYSYEDWTVRFKRYYGGMGIKEFADHWRAWGTQTKLSFWRFE